MLLKKHRFLRFRLIRSHTLILNVVVINRFRFLLSLCLGTNNLLHKHCIFMIELLK